MRTLAIVALLSACGERRPPPPASVSPTTPPSAPVAAPADDAPSCDAIVAAIRDAAVASSGATTEEDRAYILKFIASTLDKTRKDCETTPWSATHRRCLHAAQGEHAMLACDREAAIERGEDLGGPSCDQVADHLAKVTLDGIGTTPEHEAELRDRYATYCQPWPRKQKECVLAAKTQDAITRCSSR